MNEDKKHQEPANEQSPKGAGAGNIGCMIAAIAGIILFIAVIVTAVIVLVMSLFSEDNFFSDWDFGFIDDVNNYLAESLNEDSADGAVSSAEVAGLYIQINDYYYEDIGMYERSDAGAEAFILEVTVTNEERETYALTPSSFHLEIDGINAYPYFDGSMRVNSDTSDTGEYRDYMIQGDRERFLVVFEVPSYIDFNQDKTLVFTNYLDDEQATFNLPH